MRARALARRRLGRAGARALATSGSLASSVEALAASPYGRDVRAGSSLADAQRAVGAVLLWHLRVLAGWQPAEGSQAVRALAGWFEIANVDDLLRALSGTARPEPYRLGRLAVAWPRLVAATSAEQVHRVLAASAWGDPGGETPWQVGIGMRCAWAERVAEVSGTTRRWAAGGVALMLARERFGSGRTLNERAVAPAVRLLGSGILTAASLPEAAARLPASAQDALAGVTTPEDLWAAEARWWARVERDGFGMLRGARFGLDAPVGTAAVLAVDAWRVAAALEVAARGGSVAVFDALA
ncbi:MAG TPA: hypothetical protein VH573_07400 [Mycobacteriales bacterium]